MLPALLFSYTANAEPADSEAGGPYARASGSESVLTRWHDYALATITPQFTWAALPATNAALLAASVLALSDPALSDRLAAWRKAQTEAVAERPEGKA